MSGRVTIGSAGFSPLSPASPLMTLSPVSLDNSQIGQRSASPDTADRPSLRQDEAIVHETSSQAARASKQTRQRVPQVAPAPDSDGRLADSPELWSPRDINGKVANCRGRVVGGFSLWRP